MNVSSILRRKGTQVQTTVRTTLAGEAARRMSDEGIGSLVVVGENQQILGIVTERDIVHAVASRGAGALALPVEVLFSGRPAECAPQDPVAKVMRLMTTGRVRHVVVVADGALVGLVSIGDVVKIRLDELRLEVDVLRDHARMRP